MSIGETLAQARRAAGLSIAQVSERTRIRETLIRGIEHDDYSGCGGDFYARGHIRAIARVVGTDPEPLIAQYDAAPPGPPTEPTLSVFPSVRPVPPDRPGPATGPARASGPATSAPPAGPAAVATSAGPPGPVTPVRPAGPIGFGEPVEPARPAWPGGRKTSTARTWPSGRNSPAGGSALAGGVASWETAPARPAAPARPTALPRPAAYPGRRRQRRNWPILLGALAVVALGLLGYHLVASSFAALGSGNHGVAHHPARTRPGRSPRPRHSGASTATTPAKPAVLAQTLTPVSAAAFGVGGPGQGDNPQLAPLAIAGSPAEAWQTDWYASASFGNLYPGTGLLLDMGRPVTVTGARLTLSPAPGTDLQLRAGSVPSLAALRPVASATGVAGVVRLSISRPARGRYLLIWLTKLPPDPNGTFQATVSDVKLKGRV